MDPSRRDWRSATEVFCVKAAVTHDDGDEYPSSSTAAASFDPTKLAFECCYHRRIVPCFLRSLMVVVVVVGR